MNNTCYVDSGWPNLRNFIRRGLPRLVEGAETETQLNEVRNMLKRNLKKVEEKLQ